MKQAIITITQLLIITQIAKDLAHLLFSKIKQFHLFIYKYLLSNSLEAMKLKFASPLKYNFRTGTRQSKLRLV
jgi:hypothetical protein